MAGLSHTVSGDIASFRTPSRVPIESLKIHFLPKQAGSGDASPTNIRDISGWTGLNGLQLCKNLIQFTAKTTDSFGVIWVENEYGVVEYEGTPTSWSSILVGRVELNGITKLYGKIFGDESNVSFNSLYVFDANENRLAIIGSPWESSTHDDRYVEIDLSEYPTASYVEIRLKRALNVYMKGKCYAVVTDDLNYLRIPITFPSNGKNIFDVSSYPFTASNWIHGGAGDHSANSPNYKCTLNFIPIERFAGKTLTLNKCPGGSNSGVAFYTTNALSGFISGVKNNSKTSGTPMTFTVPANAKYMRFTVPADATDIQIELGDTATSYEPYSSDNTFYGGYIDPVVGEIVMTHEMVSDKWKNWTFRIQASGNDVKRYKFKNFIKYTNGGQGLCISNVAKKKWEDIKDGTPHFYFSNVTSQTPNHGSIEMFLPIGFDEETVVQVIGELIDPIHIPIATQDLKAFLDHNNFWSDANGITEATYAVTESKDILATRKKAMDFDHAHHRKVKWNQLIKELILDYWKPYKDVNTLTANDGELTLTLNEISSVTYQNSIITNTSARTNCIPGHKYYFIYYFCPSWDTYGIGFSILNQTSPVYPQAYANTYTKCSGICAHSGNLGMYNVMLAYSEWDKSWTVGNTIKCKTPIMVDMTLMFGEGNEPSTTEEFEHICELNGIDLTTYQPYDEGSDRWLIIP